MRDNVILGVLLVVAFRKSIARQLLVALVFLGRNVYPRLTAYVAKVNAEDAAGEAEEEAEVET